jgi:hypothetical protein
VQDNGMVTPKRDKTNGAPFEWFVASSIVSSLLFLFIVVLCMMVPGVSLGQRRCLFGSSVIILTGSLSIGLWRFSTTEAPVNVQPVGPILASIVVLETLWSLANLFAAGNG